MKRTDYIDKMTDDFLTFHGAANQTENQVKLGIHWRYNKGDWSNRCKTTTKTGKIPKTLESRQFQCKTLAEVNGTFIAKAIKNWWSLMVRQDPSLLEGSSNSLAYLAAPPGESEILEELEEDLSADFVVLTSLDIKAWILNTYWVICKNGK